MYDSSASSKVTTETVYHDFHNYGFSATLDAGEDNDAITNDGDADKCYIYNDVDSVNFIGSQAFGNLEMANFTSSAKLERDVFQNVNK